MPEITSRTRMWSLVGGATDLSSNVAYFSSETMTSATARSVFSLLFHAGFSFHSFLIAIFIASGWSVSRPLLTASKEESFGSSTIEKLAARGMPVSSQFNIVVVEQGRFVKVRYCVMADEEGVC